MDFVAIDFETATSSFSSICSMGICVVENNCIVHQDEILIRPQPLQFHDYNILIHGITPDMVANEPDFQGVWNQVRPYLDSKTVVAHNAQFDVGALRATLDLYDLPYPTFDYLCTVKLSQKAYPDFPSHKLNRLCDYLGITFSHHHAGDDAYACAKVLLSIIEDFSLDSIEELEHTFEIGIGHLFPGCYVPCTKNRKKRKAEK
jgi:DNA polymerase-3 subunit epsilon